MEENMEWFVVNVHTGCEDKVARGLREQIDKRRLNAFFGEILVPTREVTEIRGGRRVKSEKKFFGSLRFRRGYGFQLDPAF